MRAERGIDLAHTTLMRWVQHYVPKFAKHWQRYARPVERSWRIDETYIKIRGKWGYLYRGVVRSVPSKWRQAREEGYRELRSITT
jgi:putative transposase